MTNAAGQHFGCYDRQELKSEVAMLRQIGNMQWQMEQLINSQNFVVEALNAVCKKLRDNGRGSNNCGPAGSYPAPSGSPRRMTAMVD